MKRSEASQESSLVRDPVEELAEDFLRRYRAGERPSFSEFVARAPEFKDEILDLFPALVLMERASPAIGSPPANVPLERLGEYRIIREVGRGGMGIVYEAEHEALGRRVALKILPRASAAEGNCLLRFLREARSAARLHHTNIVPVFDVGERDGVHYYAMQFIQGQGLDDVIAELGKLRALGDAIRPDSLARRAKLPPSPPRFEASRAPDESSSSSQDSLAQESSNAFRSAETLEGAGLSVLTRNSQHAGRSDVHFYQSVAKIGLQAADALAYAHGQRVLHRDIKPSNLLLDEQGVIWVTDFGLAKDEGDDLTRTGDLVGTLRYMAPERFQGVSEPRGDIYGLGLSLYELLTLRPAFPEIDRASLIQRIATQEPQAPRRIDRLIPRDLETIVLKAIAKERSRRYARAEDLREDLRRFLADRPIRARRSSPRERAWRWCRRNPGWAATIGVVFGLLAVAAIGGAILSVDLNQALHDARSADAQKTERLWEANFQRARALRSSGRVGQRFEALRAIREAAKIRVTPELRDEAIAALVLPDVEIAREWEAASDDIHALAYDAKCEFYARADKHGRITICRLTDQGEEILAPLPAPDAARFWGLWMSPDGRFLAQGQSGDGEGTAGVVRVWNLEGDLPSVQLEEPLGARQYAVAFHADGRRLAIGHEQGSISVYDLESKSLLRRLSIGDPPSNLAFHPRNGELAATCGEAIRRFDTNTGAELRAFRDPQIHQWSTGLAWSPNGRLIAAAAEDKKIHLWDTRTATETLAPLEGHTEEGAFMSFNEEGDRLLSWGWDHQTRLWDVAASRLLLTMPGQYGERFLKADSTSAKDRGDASLIGVERVGARLRLWRLAEGRELRRIRRQTPGADGSLYSPVLDADGRVVAASSREALSFFDIEDGRQLASAPLDAGNFTNPRAFDRREGWMTSGDTGTILWPARRDPARPSVLLVGPPRSLSESYSAGADATPDGRLRVTPSRKRSVVFDRDRPERRVFLESGKDARYAAISPDGRWVATFGWFWDGISNNADIWEAETGRHVRELPAQGGSSGRFSPNGRWLIVHGTDTPSQLWEVDGWRAGAKFAGVGSCWSPDSRWLALDDGLGVIRIVDLATGRDAFKLTGPTANWDVPSCFSPDGGRLISVAGDHTGLDVWELREIERHLRELDLGMGLGFVSLETDPTGSVAIEDSDATRLDTAEVDVGFLRTIGDEDDARDAGPVGRP